MSSLRLKEQDDLISLIRTLQKERGTAPAFAEASALLAQHLAQWRPDAAAAPTPLQRRCPALGRVFLPLDLAAALREFDARSRITARALVPPSFSEVRQVLNLATVRAAGAQGLDLLTFDADDTIYNDGGCLGFDSPVIPHIIRLLKKGVAVAIVTAAAYPGEPARYEARLAGLLAAMAFAIEAGAPAAPLVDNFFVMGGQCSYLLAARCTGAARVCLEEVRDSAWKDHRGVRWEHAEVVATLDVAEGALRRTLAALGLREGAGGVALVRKERAVGVVPSPGAPQLAYEVLEELALATQAALAAHGGAVPMCAFNGGRDVFCDVGTKALGIRALQGLLGAAPGRTVHVGDRFTRTGNDVRARDVASTLWVASPRETVALLELLVPLLPPAPSSGSAAAASAALPEDGAVGGGGEAASPAAVGAGAGGAGSPPPSPQQQQPPTGRPALAPIAISGGGGGGGGAVGASGSLSARGSAASALSRSPRVAGGGGMGPGVAAEASFTEALPN